MHQVESEKKLATAAITGWIDSRAEGMGGVIWPQIE
jgi:hypothetical protein